LSVSCIAGVNSISHNKLYFIAVLNE
jgi:hypothetical protein